MTAVDPDVVEELGDRIATLSAHVHAATHRLLMLIAEFDRLRGWELAGYSDCARWLAVRTGIDLGAARERVRAARALVDLPLTSAAMSRGELSFSQVRALTRAARAESEAELLELARGATTAQLERMVRAWKKGTRLDEAARERERFRSRTFAVFPDDDGMYLVRGRLTPEVGALLMRAIEAASDALFRERHMPGAPEDRDVVASQRRADAMGLLAERALAAGFGGAECRCPARDGAAAEGESSNGDIDAPDCSSSSDLESAESECCTPGVAGREFGCSNNIDAARSRRSARDHASHEFARSDADAPGSVSSTREAAANACRCSTHEVPISGTRAERYQVILHVEPATLSVDSEPGRSELDDGTRLSPETCRRLCCDASIVRVSYANDGSILEVGRKTRTISGALRRALEVRDRGCRFPGCGLRFTDGHHVRHWAQGGATGLSNCLLLCKFHHMLVHEGGWSVVWWGPGRPVFYDPRGGAHFDGSWKPPELTDDPVAALVCENRLQGVAPDALTVGARWQRESDIPDDVYFRALEALS